MDLGIAVNFPVGSEAEPQQKCMPCFNVHQIHRCHSCASEVTTLRRLTNMHH